MGFNPPDEHPNFSERIVTPEPGKDNEERTTPLVPIAAMPVEADQTEAAPLNKIHVTVQDLSGNRMAYFLRRTLPMGKLMTHYHEANGRRPGIFRFHYDGERVLESDTPESLDMEDYGLLDAMTEQIGGANEEQTTPFKPVDATPVNAVPIEAMPTGAGQTEAPLPAVDAKNHVVVKDQGGNRMEFLLKRNLPLGKLMTYYEKATGRGPGFLRFHFDGQRINRSDTPNSLEMEDGDMLDAMFPQRGGTNKEQTASFERVEANQTEAPPLADEKRIHITVNDRSGNQIEFHFKSTLPMAKLMSYYHEAPPSRHQEAFLSKCHETQPSKCHEAPPVAEKKIHITVKDPSGNCVVYFLKRTLPMGKLMTHYHEANGRRPGIFRFHYDGDRVLEDDTPDYLEMEDHDILDAMTHPFC